MAEDVQVLIRKVTVADHAIANYVFATVQERTDYGKRRPGSQKIL